MGTPILNRRPHGPDCARFHAIENQTFVLSPVSALAHDMHEVPNWLGDHAVAAKTPYSLAHILATHPIRIGISGVQNP